MISSAFKGFLQTERTHCNQLFATFRHQHPHINAENFQEFLTQQLDPIIALLDQSEKTVSYFAIAGYQHGLDLAAKHWLGKSEFYKSVKALWRDVIPTCLPLISSQPDYWLSIFSNLLYRLQIYNPSDTQETATQQWLKLMSVNAGKCQSAAELKKLGLVLAWMSGLACYRQAALQALTELSDDLFGSISQADIKHRAQTQQAMITNRWLNFTAAPLQPFLIQKRLGNSIFFDGELTEPPKVMANESQLYLMSAKQVWLLFADAFGEMLIPAHDTNIYAMSQRQDNSEWSPHMQSYLRRNIQTHIADVATFSSCAELNDTVAFTSQDTFSVIVLNR